MASSMCELAEQSVLAQSHSQLDQLKHGDTPIIIHDQTLALLQCQYTTLLATPLAKHALQSLQSLDAQQLTTDHLSQLFRITVKRDVEAYIQQQQTDIHTAELQVLYLAIACLQLFVQNNYTLPAVQTYALLFSDNLPLVQDTAAIKHLDAAIVELLSVDGEDFYQHASQPLLLQLALTILDSQLLSHCCTLQYWRMRALFIQQQCLTTHSHTLQIQLLEQCIPQLTALYGDVFPHANDAALQLYISCQCHIEVCRIQLYYWQYTQAHTSLNTAATMIDFKAEMTGVMGVRTKFQSQKKAQLVVQHTHDSERIEQFSAIEQQPAVNPFDDVLPPNLVLDDENVLDEMKLDEAAEETHTPLTRLECSLLLNRLLLIRTTQATNLSTIQMELQAYVNTILTRDAHNYHSWAYHFVALYQRSLLERTDQHRMIRSIQQIQELSDSYAKHPDTKLSDTAHFRLYDVYLSTLQPIWEVQLSLAQCFSAAGMHKSALDLYIHLQMYEGMIETLILLDRRSDAEDLIKQQLHIQPLPKLYCLLGDITADPSHYEHAWELSKHKYPRAKRSLGRYYSRRNEHEQAVEHYTVALALNPAFPHEWFTLGWCAMQIKDYHAAANAFTKAVNLDSEEGEWWNNLAVCHTYLQNKPSAFKALEQAVRLKQDSWRLYENYTLLAVDVGEYQKAMNGVERVVKLKKISTPAAMVGADKAKAHDAPLVDITVLHALTETAIKAQESQPYLIKRMFQMLDTISTDIPSNPAIYRSYAELHAASGNPQQAFDYREKQLNALLAIKGWSDSVDRFEAVVLCAEQLYQQAVQLNKSDALYSTKSLLDSIVIQAKKSPAIEQACQSQIAQLEQSITKISEARRALRNGASTGSASGNASSSYLAQFK